MILTVKQARRKIEEGSLETIARWKVQTEHLNIIFEEIDAELKKTFLRRVLIFPIIIWAIGLYATFGNDNPEVGSYVFIFGIAMLGVTYAWAKVKPGFLKRKWKNASEAFFGENWLLFGNVFFRWKNNSSMAFKHAYIEEDHEVPMLIVTVKNTGKGSGEFSHLIPVSEENLPDAQQVINTWTSKS